MYDFVYDMRDSNITCDVPQLQLCERVITLILYINFIRLSNRDPKIPKPGKTTAVSSSPILRTFFMNLKRFTP
jgi:hypothetical protein